MRSCILYELVWTLLWMRVSGLNKYALKHWFKCKRRNHVSHIKRNIMDSQAYTTPSLLLKQKQVCSIKCLRYVYVIKIRNRKVLKPLTGVVLRQSSLHFPWPFPIKTHTDTSKAITRISSKTSARIRPQGVGTEGINITGRARNTFVNIWLIKRKKTNK